MLSQDFYAEQKDTAILILDDVFAELDASRREKLAALCNEFGQVFITTAVIDDVPPSLHAQKIHVQNSQITYDTMPENTQIAHSADTVGIDGFIDGESGINIHEKIEE